MCVRACVCLYCGCGCGWVLACVFGLDLGYQKEREDESDAITRKSWHPIGTHSLFTRRKIQVEFV